MTLRRLIAALAVVASFGAAHFAAAQFTNPTCVPPNCNPAVIQNISVSSGAQSASINISGAAKFGGTVQTGGQTMVPFGSLSSPSYSFVGDTNTGMYASAADTLTFVTAGNSRMQISPAGLVSVTGTFIANTSTANAAGVTGIAQNAGSGVSGTVTANSGGTNYGVSGSAFGSAIGYGVYGQYLGTNANGFGVLGSGPVGVYGSSTNGIGGYFSSGGPSEALRAQATAAPWLAFAALGSSVLGSQPTHSTTVNGTFKLGAIGADPTGSNGMMYYSTASNRFRCYEGSAWKDCITAASAGLTGGGTTNALAKFTGASTIGNSLMTDNGTVLGVAETLEVSPTSNLWNEGVVINPSTANGYDGLFLRTVAGTYAGGWVLGKTPGSASPANAFFIGKEGLTGMAGTTRADAPLLIAANGTVSFGGSVGFGTSSPAAKMQVVNGASLLNHFGNNPQTANYANADLVLGDNVSTRNGMNGTNGSNLMLQSNDKSSITALDEGNNLGQISYQNLQWTIGENVGWGNQTVSVPGQFTVGGGCPGGYAMCASGGTLPGYFLNTSDGTYAALGLKAIGVEGVASSGGNATNIGGYFSVSGGWISNQAGVFYAWGNDPWGVYIGAGGAKKPGGGSWTSTSDARTKKDVSPFTDGLEVIRAMHPVNYTYNGLADTTDGLKGIGFIAQDVKDVAPYLVKTQMLRLHPTDTRPTEIYDLDPSALPFIDLNAIKELDALVSEQRKEIDELKAEVESLKKERQ